MAFRFSWISERKSGKTYFSEVYFKGTRERRVGVNKTYHKGPILLLKLSSGVGFLMLSHPFQELLVFGIPGNVCWQSSTGQSHEGQKNNDVYNFLLKKWRIRVQDGSSDQISQEIWTEGRYLIDRADLQRNAPQWLESLYSPLFGQGCSWLEWMNGMEESNQTGNRVFRDTTPQGKRRTVAARRVLNLLWFPMIRICL